MTITNPFYGLFFDEADLADPVADAPAATGAAAAAAAPSFNPTAARPVIDSKTRVYKFVTKNFSFTNTMRGDQIDVKKLMDEYHLIAGQECNDGHFAAYIKAGKNPTWGVQQNPSGWEKSGGLNAWDKRIGNVQNRGTELLVKPGAKSRINTRYIKWVDWIAHGTNRPVRVLSIHMPPRDEWKWSPPAARNVIEFARRSPYPIMIGADWNIDGGQNFGINDALGLRSYKMGIDGWAIPKQIKVVGDRKVEPKGHSDHHGIGIHWSWR